MDGWEDIRKIVSRKTTLDSPRARRDLANLSREPKLLALAAAVGRRDGSVWIVGGALRDVVLGRDVPEVDVAVTGDDAAVEAVAAEVASASRGRAVLLSGDRRPSVFRVGGEGPILDVAGVEGGRIETDLARRDFTANAIAAALPSLALVDPSRGLSDLASRRLRMVSRANLESDPLRALRAARLLATHGLRSDPATSAACRRVARTLARVARERVQAELAKLLEARRVVPALRWAARADLFGPSFGVPISRRRALAVARSLAPFDRDAVSRLPPGRRRRLRLALLFDGFGSTPRAASAALRRGRWGRVEADEVGRLLALARAARDLTGPDPTWKWILRAGDRASDALRLLEAMKPRARATVRRIRARTSVARRRTPPEVSGADVLDWTDLPPGPHVGRLLELARVEALAGRIKTRQEVRDWLRRKCSHPGTD